VEELETSNEELQSLNEELQSSNEELQSSNEELETSNEELQSTNEELQIAYAQLREATNRIEAQSKKIKTSEVNAKALLSNTLQAFILIDQNYKIISLNKTAITEMDTVFGKKPKRGDSIIEYQLPGYLEQFHKDFNKALKGHKVAGEKKLTTVSNEPLWVRYNYTPVVDSNDKVEIISYSQLNVSEQKQFETELTKNEHLITSIFNAADIGICVTDENGHFVKANQSYCDIYGYSLQELIGQPFTMVLPEGKREQAIKTHENYLNGYPESAGTWVVQRKNGEKFKVRVTASRLVSAENNKFKVTTVAELAGPDS
jgi:two-component system CheB/CheR fusion protein